MILIEAFQKECNRLLEVSNVGKMSEIELCCSNFQQNYLFYANL